MLHQIVTIFVISAALAVSSFPNDNGFEDASVSVYKTAQVAPRTSIKSAKKIQSANERVVRFLWHEKERRVGRDAVESFNLN